MDYVKPSLQMAANDHQSKPLNRGTCPWRWATLPLATLSCSSDKDLTAFQAPSAHHQDAEKMDPVRSILFMLSKS